MRLLRRSLADSATEAPSDKGEPMKRSDLISGAVLFLFGAVTAILSLQMPIGTFRAAESGLFPLGLGMLLMVLAAASMVEAFWSHEERKEQDSVPAMELGSPLPVIAVLATMALATLLLNTLGYAVVSFLMLVGLLRLLGSQRWALNLALSLVIAAGSHVVFVYLLKIPLPRGLLGI